ncbi:hypothetical protein N7456_004559 [Penicillium angulare]|uniref:Uncharacterized protein n=1 Tax=Penicillium angulare TaxID=116970 RepID=A0A9W9FWU5_9EURO|nr:hypothetical protein N7456_004559 [Penicillium angulare]
MLSSTMPVNPTGVAEPVANPFHEFAQHSHIDEETLVQLLSAYNREEWSIFGQIELSIRSQPPSSESSLTVDPSLLELPSKSDDLSGGLPSDPIDLAVLDEILESPVSSSSNDNDSTQSSNMSSDMVVDTVSNTVSNTVPSTVPDMVSNIVPDMSSNIVPDMSSNIVPDMSSNIVPDMSSNIVADMGFNTVADMVSNTSFQTGFNPFPYTMPNTVGNIVPNTMFNTVENTDPVLLSLFGKHGRWPRPPYNQQPFCQPYYGQPYLPPQPAYNQPMYPPSAAAPFTQPVYATAPMHPMGYNPYPYMMPQYPVQMPPPMPRPMPRQMPRPQPTQPLKVFEFVDTTVPEGFVANPNNHARWEVDKDGTRHYLNAPAARR